MAGPTERCREQHREIRLAVDSLAKILDYDHLVRGAAEAGSRVSHLAGLLAAHLLLEERSLYPQLEASPDAAVRAAAQRFRVANAGLKARADLFFATWLRPEAIGARPRSFASAARELLHALSELIAAEDHELFALADALEARASTAPDPRTTPSSRSRP